MSRLPGRTQAARLDEDAMSSEVYFAQRRATQGGGLLEKLEQLCDAAGFGPMFGGGLVAVRLSFGELGNTTFLRPAYVQRVVRKLRQYGAQPFLTDTLMPHSVRRPTAAEHLSAAVAHGWGAGAVDGAPLVIADGLIGGDARVMSGHSGHLESVPVAAAIADATSLLVVSHFTGQVMTGFAGALYHLGFGATSLAGKRQIFGVEGLEGAQGGQLLLERLVDTAGAVMSAKVRKVGFVNLLLDITPSCDNQDWSDAAIVPDIGILASRDPVAVDQASIDLLNQATGIGGTRLQDIHSRDKVRDLYPVIDWEHALRYAELQKLGTRDYELMII
jgi:uncharacterized Fe-S center protein